MTRNLSTSKLLLLAFRFRGAIAALVFVITGLILMFIGQSYSTDDLHGALLDRLTSGGLDAKVADQQLKQLNHSAFLNSAFWTVGGTCVSVGLVALAWDSWLNLSWLAFVREQIFIAVTKPESIKDARGKTCSDVVESLLVDTHGEDLGKALSAGSRRMLEKPSSVRSDFSYNITLTQDTSQAHFFRAQFVMSFTLDRLDAKPCVAFSRVSDSLDFHNRYQSLVETGPATIYRYVLLSENTVNPEQAFRVTRCRISACDGSTESVELMAKPRPQTVEGPYFVELEPGRTNRQLFGRITEKRCRVDLSISTIVDADRNEFPICFGYPVKNFRSRLDAKGINAAHVDILEFFTSSRRFRREDYTADDPLQTTRPGSGVASGVLDDLILPDSGLAYIWRR